MFIKEIRLSINFNPLPMVSKFKHLSPKKIQITKHFEIKKINTVVYLLVDSIFTKYYLTKKFHTHYPSKFGHRFKKKT